MNRLLETLYDATKGKELPLPTALSELYDRLSFPTHADRPYIVSNFVSTIDGVVALNAQDKSVGDVISGSNEHDSMVMGLLRAAADVVLNGAGTLRASPRHIWSPSFIYPPLADAYQTMRDAMGKLEAPLNVFVTASGSLDPSLPVFQSGEVPVLIITTTKGADRISKLQLPGWCHVTARKNTSELSAREILNEIKTIRPLAQLILLEGGPHLLGHFFDEDLLDELFLTLAPQVAGRESPSERLGLVAGKIFSPERPEWGSLLSVKRAGDHLFLRYGFDRKS